MEGNSSHERDDDDGSEVPHRESKRGVDGDPMRQRELETKLEAMARQRELDTMKLEAMARRVEVLEQKLASFHNSSSRPSFDQFDPSQRRDYQLHFDGKLPATTYTGSRIESEDSKPVRIVIFDPSKEIISAGPLSSMKVEIVPLDGDFGANDQGEWTEQVFNAKIVHAREGKTQLVTGESVITLRNGVGEIKNVRFTDNSSWMRSGRFRLGARAVSSISNEVGVREARSEPFRVKDQRGESYEKHYPPHLDDEIWRLGNISKDGPLRKRLSENGITTVEHFLWSYYMDRSSLRKLLGHISDRRWKTITEHATACVPDNKLYAYYREGEMGALVFNSVFQVVGVTFGGQHYQSLDKLDAVHKDWVEKMASLAYKNMNDFVQLDPLLFPSLPSNQLADPFANPSASLNYSYLAGLNQDMHQFHLESWQQKEEARKETQPQSVPVPHSEEVEEWENPLAWPSKRARVDEEEGTSASGAAAEPTYDGLSSWSSLDLLTSPQASIKFRLNRALPEISSPLSPGTHATLEANEARRRVGREANLQETQVQLESYPTVKPRDKQDFLGEWKSSLNIAKQRLIKGIPRVMATWNARLYLPKAQPDILKFIQDGLRLRDELRQLEGKVRDLENYRDKTLGHERDTKRIIGERNSLENEVRQLKGKLEEQQKIEATLHEANASVIKEHNQALEGKNHLETHLQEAKGKVEELARQLGKMDIGTIWAETIKKF